MAIAFDATTTTGQVTGDNRFTHTPVGTPKGALVYIVINGLVGTVSGVTYGGVAMAETANSPASNTTGELGGSHCFFLGSGLPTGAQTVAVDMLLGTEVNIVGCITVTAANDTSVVTTAKVESNNTTTTTATLSLGGVSSFCATGFWTGLNAVTSFAPLTSWTGSTETDFGAQCGGIYTYDIIGTTDVSGGYSNTGGDDCAMHTIAIRENAGAAATVYQLAALGVG